VRSTERRVGVSMAEVVMDDMANGDPVFPSALLPLLSLFPGLHISRIPFQVIGNSCNLIFATQYREAPVQHYS